MKTRIYIMKVTVKYCKKWHRHDYINVYRILMRMFKLTCENEQLDRNTLMLFIQYDPSLLVWRYSRNARSVA